MNKELKNNILNLLEERKELTAEEISSLLNIHNGKDYALLIKNLNVLLSDRLIVLLSDKYSLANLKLEGNVIIKRNGRAFISYENDLYEVNNNGLLNGDEVVFDIFNGQANVIEVLKHKVVYVVGLIKIKNGITHFYPDDMSFPKGYKIVNLKEFKLRSYLKVRCYIFNYEKKELKIEMVLGDAGDNEVRDLSILYSHDVYTEFSSSSNNETKLFNHEIKLSDYPKRKDFSEEMIVTIDGDSAKDFDDAIMIKKKDDGYLLGVHIADVSNYVKENSALDKDALKRGTSIYYPGHVIPMLPFELSDDLCSLVPNKNRLTMSCVMEYDLNGNLKHYDIYESIIKSKVRLTYNIVNKIFNGDEELINEYQEVVPMLLDGYDLYKLLTSKKDSGIEFESDECEIVEDKWGNVVDVKPIESGESEKLIECFMIEANKCIASHMAYLNYPMIYRNHDYPKPDKLNTFYHFVESLGYNFKGDKRKAYTSQLAACLKSFEGTMEYPIVNAYLLRSMPKALYDNTCLGHYGLGLEHYCHFTSPIRRYPDLIVHRMLKKYVINNPDINNISIDEENNGKLVNKCNEREKIATEVERDIVDLKKCEYLKKHLGEKYLGVISSVTSFGFYVKLENTIEGLVHVKTLDGYYDLLEDGSLSNGFKKYKIGDVVKIRVEEVDLIRQDIDFRLIERRNKHE